MGDLNGTNGEIVNYNGYKNLSSPLMVSLYVTSKCNLRCLHCFNNSGDGDNDELSDEELVDVAKQIAEMHPAVVCLCGGETLLRKNIVELVEMLAPNVGNINLVTNGYLLTKEKARALKKAGIKIIQISLDGYKPVQHDTLRNKRGAFEAAVAGIRNGIESGIKMAVSFVPNKLNYRTFSEFIDFCYEIGIRDVRSMPLIPMGRGSAANDLLMNSEDYIYLQQQIIKKEIEYEYKGLTIDWGDPLDHLRRMPYNSVLGSKSYVMEIAANGDMSVSTYLPIVVGNVREKSLMEYWKGGYDDVWKQPQIIEYLNSIENTYDFNDFECKPYSGDKIEINLAN